MPTGQQGPYQPKQAADSRYVAMSSVANIAVHPRPQAAHEPLDPDAAGGKRPRPRTVRSAMANTHSYDLIVIGGGIAGPSLAGVVASSGHFVHNLANPTRVD